MRDTIPATSKRLARIETEAATQFETTIVENRVYEAIGRSDEIRQLVDVAERAYQLEESDQYVRRVRQAAFGAAEDLNDEIGDVVDAVIASECEAVIEDARDDWFDGHADEEEIDAAFHEACAWLVENSDAASDAGIDVEVIIWNDEECEKEVTADA